jgi:hypothetical protein
LGEYKRSNKHDLCNAKSISRLEISGCIYLFGQWLLQLRDYEKNNQPF